MFVHRYYCCFIFYYFQSQSHSPCPSLVLQIHYLRTSISELEGTLSGLKATNSDWEAKFQLMRGKMAFRAIERAEEVYNESEGRDAWAGDTTELASFGAVESQEDIETESGFLVVPREGDPDREYLVAFSQAPKADDPSTPSRKRSGSAPEAVTADMKERLELSEMKERHELSEGSFEEISRENKEFLSRIRSLTQPDSPIERKRAGSLHVMRDADGGDSTSERSPLAENFHSPSQRRSRSPSPGFVGENVFSRLAPVRTSSFCPFSPLP